MQTPDIDIFSLGLCLLLILIPLAFSAYFKLGIIRSTLVSIARMGLQLGLVGIFLNYLFELDNFWLTFGWLLMMTGVAAVTVARDTGMKVRTYGMPIFWSLAFTTFFILLYFNLVIIDDTGLLEARYAIAIGGMLLGNSLKGGIVGIRNFYDVVRREHNNYSYHLALGATRLEALQPYLQNAFRIALVPTIATMSTLGIVFLPGMMTGQILGGSSPMLAIKYQIAIMIAIFACTALGVGLAILFTIHKAFDEFGMLRADVQTKPSK